MLNPLDRFVYRPRSSAAKSGFAASRQADLSEPRDEFANSFYVAATIMFYVYLLQCQNDKSWYIGATSDLKRRLVEHQSGKGGKTTKEKGNWSLIYFEGYLDKDDAFGREKFLKSGGGRKYLKKQLSNFLK